MVQSAEAEIFVTDDVATVYVDRHIVAPDVPCILLAAYIRQVACVAGRIIFVGVHSEYLEAFRGNFGTGIGISVICLRLPDAVGGIRVVAMNGYFASFCHGFFIPLDGDRCHHRLACKPESARRTVIEYIPLAVDFLQTAVRVVCGIGGLQLAAIFVKYHTTRVYQYTSAAPRT